MNLSVIFKHLKAIDHSAQLLLSEAKYSPGWWPQGEVCPIPHNPENALLRDSASKLMASLYEMHELLSYLDIPTHGVYSLKEMPGGRYGYHDNDGNPHVFTCGARFEALVPDCEWDEEPMWAVTRMEHDGSHYYIVGFNDVSLSGLPVRERW